MMNILEKIIAQKHLEVEQRKKERAVASLKKEKFFQRQPVSLKAALLAEGSSGIIAEFKRRSPSKGVINESDSVETVTACYALHGATGISILTDEKFFGGSLADLVAATQHGIPLLRKDFIIDEYQVVEAKAFGADVILLIAACLTPWAVKTLSATAKNLGLEVLLELHDETELEHICNDVDMVGINNRNLKSFEVDLDHSIRLSSQLDKNLVKISESGIDSVNTIHFLQRHGFRGFLIGEHFMKQNTRAAFKTFMDQL